LLASTTPEKVEQYNAIARANDLPILFRRLNEVTDGFHSAAEDTSDREKNTIQKIDEVRNFIESCRNPSTLHRSVLKEKCTQWGVAFDLAKVHVASDDHTFSMPRKIWANLRNKLLLYVDEKLLVSADKNGTDAGPGAETGPILSAVGTTRFYNLLREAALETGYRKGTDVKLQKLVTFAYVSLSDLPEQAAHIINTGVPVHLFTPLGLTKPFPPPAATLPNTEHFCAHASHPDKTIAENLDEYLALHSERKLVLDALKDKLGVEARPAIGREFVSAGRRAVIKRRTSYRVLQFGDGEYIQNIGPFSLKHLPSRSFSPAFESFSLAPQLDVADALVLAPFDAGNTRLRLKNYFALFSAVVARQLESRNMNMPVIVMDDGCWGPALKWLTAMTNKGMYKDFIRSPLYEGRERLTDIEGVSHHATSYLDVVSIDQPENKSGLRRLKKAAGQVLQHRLAEYNRYRSPLDLDFSGRHGGALPPDKPFTVAVFISASSDNIQLNGDAERFGQHAGKKSWGMAWGAGDRHSMGAVDSGYKKGSGVWKAGISTPTIVKSETTHGRIPTGCDYWGLTPDIFQRMAELIAFSDVVNVFPGGPGTTQEMLAFLYLKETKPEIMEDKRLVIYSPDLHKGCSYKGEPYWDQGLRAILGEEKSGQILRDPNILAAQGLYLARDYASLISINEQLASEHTLRAGRRAEADATLAGRQGPEAAAAPK
jgi:predicted Rossmann-fold nucleotide-binding protein